MSCIYLSHFSLLILNFRSTSATDVTLIQMNSLIMLYKYQLLKKLKTNMLFMMMVLNQNILTLFSYAQVRKLHDNIKLSKVNTNLSDSMKVLKLRQTWTNIQADNSFYRAVYFSLNRYILLSFKTL